MIEIRDAFHRIADEALMSAPNRNAVDDDIRTVEGALERLARLLGDDGEVRA